MLASVLRVLRRDRRETSVRVYELLVLLVEGARSTLAIERELGAAGTRRVLHEALHAGYVRLRDDAWRLTEYGAGVVCRLEENIRRVNKELQHG